jgi:hypothetical protein
MAVWFVQLDEAVQGSQGANGDALAGVDIDALTRVVRQSRTTHQALARPPAELQARVGRLPVRPGLGSGSGTKS